MTLEIIERGKPSPDRPTLLFVHGFWQAAWTWDIHVMPILAERGHHCAAVSLRGHGGSPGEIRGSSISDYVDDVASAVVSLEGTPVLVGHSMGGLTVQHYLGRGGPARAAILVSPVPRKGAWGASLKAAKIHPWAFLKANLTTDVGAIVETPTRAHDFLVADEFPREEIMDYLHRLERASYRAYMDMLFRRPSRPDRAIPSLVIGGTEDAFFDPEEWQDTADGLGGAVLLLEGIGHQPMWERSGVELADAIDRFVTAL